SLLRDMQCFPTRRSSDLKIYGLGEWGEVGGLILTNWEVKKISQDPLDYDDVSMGQDFGFNHADCILLLAYKDGNIYILRELYKLDRKSTRLNSSHVSISY